MLGPAQLALPHISSASNVYAICAALTGVASAGSAPGKVMLMGIFNARVAARH